MKDKPNFDTGTRAERMAADAMLAVAREAVTAWEQADPGSRAGREAAERATGAIAALDDWLSHGGRLPGAWRPATAGSGSLTNIPEGEHRIAGIPVLRVINDPQDFQYSRNPIVRFCQWWVS